MDASQKQLDKLIDYKAVFESDKGRAVLWDLMKCCGYNETNFDENPYKTAYNEGARAMVCRIVSLIGMDIGEVERLMAEQRKKEKQYEHDYFNG